MVDGPTTRQCCYLTQETLRYSQPGDQIMYYKKEAELECKRGWTGPNCDSCVTNFGPPGHCDRCLPRFKGDNCDTCAEGFPLPPVIRSVMDSAAVTIVTVRVVSRTDDGKKPWPLSLLQLYWHSMVKNAPNWYQVS